MTRRLIAVLGCMFLVFVGCAQDEDPTLESPAATEDASGATGGNAVIGIASPEDGAKVKAGDVAIEVAVGGFEVVDKLGDDAADGEGHVHFYIDVDEVPTAAGKPAVTDDESTYHAAATTKHTWEGVKKGAHTLAAQLVNNDHTPLDPPKVAQVRITVE